MPVKYSFSSDTTVTRWLIEPILPLGQLVFFLAQAGVGKSLLLECLAVHIVHEIPFCGFNTKYGDVLIIDQDTPTDVLMNRLGKFGRALGTKPKHNLIVSSQEELSLSNNTLITLIKDYPNVVLVIIDCLNTVVAGLNPNTYDMSKLGTLKAKCLTPDLTIAFNHHISEKKELSLESLMINDPHAFAMGNSAINQNADTYYIVGASAENGTTDKIYVRPVAKRAQVRSTPLVLKMIQPKENCEILEYFSDWNKEMNDVELDCLALFKENSSDRTVKQVFDDIGQQHAIKDVREALNNLRNKGFLIRSNHQHNLFKYRLPERIEIKENKDEQA